MNILGINAYHGDSAACLLIDGQMVAAAEEERFKRIKHWAGLPVDSITYCLDFVGISLMDVDHIAINRNPSAHLLQKAIFAFSKRPSFHMIKNRLKNAGKISDIKNILCDSLNIAL